MLTHSHGVYKAKTRGHNFANAIGEVVKNPNMAELYNTLLTSEGYSKQGESK